MSSEQIQFLVGEGFYDLWLATLILAFSAAVILLHNYLKSRKTYLGRAALYTALSALVWSISVSIYTFPEIEKIQIEIGSVFLAVGFFAGVVTLLSAYERAKIQTILTPSMQHTYTSKPLLVISLFILPITFIGVISDLVRYPAFNSAVGSISILTVICLVFISVCLLSANPRVNLPKKITNYLAIFVLAVGIILLVWYFAINYMASIDASLPGGPTSIETAKGFVFASLGIFIVGRHGLKAWFARIILAMGILFVVILDLVAEFLFHPAFLANFVALSFVLVAIVQLVTALKAH